MTWRRAVWGGVWGAWWVGCLAPTIPLPPPERPDFFEGSAAGQVLVASDGGALREAIVTVYNTNDNVPHGRRVCASLADLEGRWGCELQAGAGDRLMIYQELNGTLSDYLEIYVPPTLREREADASAHAPAAPAAVAPGLTGSD